MVKQKKMISKFLRPALLMAIAVIIFFGVVSYSLVKSVIDSSFQAQANSTIDFFSGAIRNDLVTGVDIEVFQKCKKISEDITILKVMVIDVSGREICNLNSDESRQEEFSLRRSIYFGDDELVSAGEVMFGFVNPVSKSLVNRIVLVILFSVFSLICVYWVSSRFFIKRETDFFVNLSRKLQESKAEELLNVSENFPKNDCYEFSQLCEGVEKLSKNWIFYQDELIKNEKLKIETDLKDKISRQVAHDIKSPLGALKIAGANIADESNRSADLVKKAVERIEKIVNDLERRNIINQYAELEMGNYLKEVISLKELEYSADKVKFKIDIPKGKVYLKVDKIQLDRSLSNIINNSIEASDDRLSEVSVRLSEGENKILIEINDNGAGIHPNDLSRVLEYGFTKGKVGGAGTGLASANEFMNRNGGKITVSSELNMGTVVTFIFRN